MASASNETPTEPFDLCLWYLDLCDGKIDSKAGGGLGYMPNPDDKFDFRKCKAPKDWVDTFGPDAPTPYDVLVRANGMRRFFGHEDYIVLEDEFDVDRLPPDVDSGNFDNNEMMKFHQEVPNAPDEFMPGKLLQIYSVEINDMKQDIGLVFGEILVFDSWNCEYIFNRANGNAQKLKNGGSLALTGPRRVSIGMDWFEIYVRLLLKSDNNKEGEHLCRGHLLWYIDEHEQDVDKVIMRAFRADCGVAKVKFVLMSRAREVKFGIKTTKGKTGDIRGQLVAVCGSSDEKFVLFDSRNEDKFLLVDDDKGYIKLWRPAMAVPESDHLMLIFFDEELNKVDDKYLANGRNQKTYLNLGKGLDISVEVSWFEGKVASVGKN